MNNRFSKTTILLIILFYSSVSQQVFADPPVCDACFDQDFVNANYGGDFAACQEALCVDIPININSYILICIGIMFRIYSYSILKFRLILNNYKKKQ